MVIVLRRCNFDKGADLCEVGQLCCRVTKNCDCKFPECDEIVALDVSYIFLLKSENENGAIAFAKNDDGA
jgi:hypothetical protein